MNYYIGVDIGTTHIKTALFNENGKRIKIFKEDTKTIKDSYGELYSSKFVVDIVLTHIKECQKYNSEISGIAVTGMAEAGLVINRNTFEELTDIIPWFDLRTIGLNEEYLNKHEDFNEKEIFIKTGLRNSYKYGVYKYLWSLNELDLNKDETMWLSICDYVVLKLTGIAITEPTFAARTLLFDVNKGKWCEELIELFGLNKEMLPKIVKSGEIVGFFENIPVSLCGHDHLCCAYGLSIDNKSICNSMGTSETYVSIEEKIDSDLLFDKGVVYGPFVDNNNFFVMANLISSGGSVEWVRNSIQKESITYQELYEILDGNTKPTNILYYPFLSGIGTPSFKNEISATFMGLKHFNNKDDLIKSVIEGISFHSKYILDRCFDENKLNIICIGGAVNCKPWLDIKANIVNRKLFSTEETEGSLFGAVKLMLDVNEIDNEFFISDYVSTYSINEELSSKYKVIYEEKYLKLLNLILEL